MNAQQTPNLAIKEDQAKAEPKSIITLAVTRCTDKTANHKALAPTIIPGTIDTVLLQTHTRDQPPHPSISTNSPYPKLTHTEQCSTHTHMRIVHTPNSHSFGHPHEHKAIHTST